ncbi:MAG: hypothetical protein EBZ77_12400 [Chitinophagia bacterium]|nr:hypothetical protein [Chitinophagia bacterium]
MTLQTSTYGSNVRHNTGTPRTSGIGLGGVTLFGGSTRILSNYPTDVTGQDSGTNPAPRLRLTFNTQDIQTPENTYGQPRVLCGLFDRVQSANGYGLHALKFGVVLLDGTLFVRFPTGAGATSGSIPVGFYNSGANPHVITVALVDDPYSSTSDTYLMLQVDGNLSPGALWYVNLTSLGFDNSNLPALALTINGMPTAAWTTSDLVTTCDYQWSGTYYWVSLESYSSPTTLGVTPSGWGAAKHALYAHQANLPYLEALGFTFYAGRFMSSTPFYVTIGRNSYIEGSEFADVVETGVLAHGYSAVAKRSAEYVQSGGSVGMFLGDAQVGRVVQVGNGTGTVELGTQTPSGTNPLYLYGGNRSFSAKITVLASRSNNVSGSPGMARFERLVMCRTNAAGVASIVHQEVILDSDPEGTGYTVAIDCPLPPSGAAYLRVRGTAAGGDNVNWVSRIELEELSYAP